MIQRGGEVVIRMLANVQQTTIAPIIKATVSLGSLIYTDEYNIYSRLETWGMDTKQFAIALGNMLVMKTEMIFVKSMSIRLRDFGLCYAPGYALTEGFLRRSYPYI